MKRRLNHHLRAFQNLDERYVAPEALANFARVESQLKKVKVYVRVVDALVVALGVWPGKTVASKAAKIREWPITITICVCMLVSQLLCVPLSVLTVQGTF